MSYGCPVITSNTSSMPEVAGDSALLVDPNNYNEIADSIILLEHNLLFRQKLIELGLKNSAKYSWEKVSEDTLKVYTKIIKN
jgi:glycosyltransferase involved in cell wall biosynthesis